MKSTVFLDGDWGWLTTNNIDQDGEQFHNLNIPSAADDWYINAFSISNEKGIAVLDDPVPFSSIRMLHFTCVAPEEIHSGEYVGIKCTIINRSSYNLETYIILKGMQCLLI